MSGLREFVIGFSFSLACVSLGGQLHAPNASAKISNTPMRTTKIELFKESTPSLKGITSTSLFSNIEHHSLLKDEQASVIGQRPSFEGQLIDTPDDDEILSINIDGDIPIEYSTASQDHQTAEVLHYEEADISAMLPDNVDNEVNFTEDTPWLVVKGSKHAKNKQLLQELESKDIAKSINEDFTLVLEENKEDSYRVAEKIKSSLLFPIPNEILNDENLTPTFIKKKNKTTEKTNKDPSTPPQSPELKIIPQEQPKQTTDIPSQKGFLDNISSWFTPLTEEKTKEETKEKRKEIPTTKTKTAPSYSSQDVSTGIQEAAPSNNNEFVSFYKTLQETNTAHQNNSIVPSELKLSFQPERAEISGQTLRWLKAFSEAAQNDDTYLQVRLDVSASTELQRKRLNLLYTIFMNNGVDFKKIDTVFSLTEPNAFIIRTLKIK